MELAGYFALCLQTKTVMVLAWTKAKFSRIKFTLRKCWDHRSTIPLLNVPQWHNNHSCPQRGQGSRGCCNIGKGESWQLKPWGSLGGEICACPVSGPWVLAGEGGWNLLLQMCCLLSHHIHGERAIYTALWEKENARVYEHWPTDMENEGYIISAWGHH